MKVRFPDETESNSRGLAIEGGSFGSFFKHLGNDIKHAAKTVGNTAISVGKKAVNEVGNDLYKSGKSAISYNIQHPELGALALGAVSGGSIHQKHFNKQINNLVREKQMNGGAFSISKLAKTAYSNASKLAKNELNKTKNAVSREYENKIKPELLKAKNTVAKNVKDKYNDGYDRIKTKIQNAYDAPSTRPKQQMMQDDSSEYDNSDVEEVGAGRKRKGGSVKSKRGELISKLMHKHGMSLGEASHHIKAHNLM